MRLQLGSEDIRGVQRVVHCGGLVPWGVHDGGSIAWEGDEGRSPEELLVWSESQIGRDGTGGVAVRGQRGD